ncbi:MAG: argininosuccinate lyase [Elusimicrobiota bacterium]
MKKLWETNGKLDGFVAEYTVGGDAALDVKFLKYEVLGSLAHAASLVRIGLLKRGEFQAIQTELKKLLANEKFTVRPEQEDIHTAVEQALTESLGETGKRIHAGRSRNDQVQTNLRLYMKDGLLKIHAAACSAAQAWLGFAEAQQTTLMPGYTHLQRAMPTTVGHWAASHAEALLEGLGALESAFAEADASPLGSAAGFGVPLPLDRPYTAGLMGFSRVQRNTLRVQSSRPRIEAAAVSALTLLARDLGVLAGDISLFTTAEFAFFKLGEDFTTGSSIMPQKRNPDLVELTRAKAALFPGWLSQILAIGQLPSGYHRDYQLSKAPLCAAFETAAGMLEAVRRLPESLQVDTARCKAAVTREMTATQKALEAVRGGVPFREAYQTVAEKMRGASAASCDADEISLPEYPGAPGNPGFAEIAAAISLRRKWSEERIRDLDAAWDALLRLDVS